MQIDGLFSRNNFYFQKKIKSTKSLQQLHENTLYYKCNYCLIVCKHVWDSVLLYTTRTFISVKRITDRQVYIKKYRPPLRSIYNKNNKNILMYYPLGTS